MNTAKKRSFLVAVVCLILCVALLVGTTFAWFTDSVSNTGNKIQAGTLDVKLLKGAYDAAAVTDLTDISSETTPVFNYDKWEPGYSTGYAFAVQNAGNLALKYELEFYVTAESKGTHVTSTDTSLLSKVLDVYVNETNVGKLESFVNKSFSSGSILPAGSTASGDAKVGDSGLIKIKIVMPESAGNEYQGASLSFDIRLKAAQLTYEEDGFGDDTYDENALYPVLAPVINETVNEEVENAGEEVVISSSNGTSVIPEASETGGIQVKTSEKTTDSSEKNDYAFASGSSLARTIRTTASTDSSVTYNISYIYSETEGQVTSSYNVTEFAGVVKNTVALSAGLKNVKVSHSHGTEKTEMTAAASEDAGTDGQYFYNAATGRLTIWSSKYSDFEISYDADYVAAVNSQGYTTLADAVNAAGDGDTVILLKDAPVSSPITISSSITIDLKDYDVAVSVAGDNAFTIAAGKTVTVRNGSVTDKANGQCWNPFKVADNTTETDSILNLNSVDFGTFYTDDAALVRLGSGKTNAVLNNVTGTTNWRCLNSGGSSSASLTATNCTLTCNSNKAAVYSPKVSEINNCTICNNGSGYVLGVPNENTMTVNGGTYTGAVVLKIYTSGGHIIADGITVTGTSYAVYGDSRNAGEAYDHSGDITIKGNSVITGTVGTQHAAKVYLQGGTYTVSGWSASIANSIVLTGGEYSCDPTILNGFVVADGYESSYNATKKVWVVEEIKPVVNITKGSSYDTLQSAINDASAGDSLKINIDLQENVSVDKALTLELNGHTLKQSASGTPTVTISGSNAELTVSDSSTGKTGTILNDVKDGLANYYTAVDIKEGGKCTLSSGILKRTNNATGAYISGYAVKLTNGTLVMNGGTVESNTDTTIICKYSTAQNKLIATGGVINARGDAVDVQKGNSESKRGKIYIDVNNLDINISGPGATGTYGIAVLKDNDITGPDGKAVIRNTSIDTVTTGTQHKGISFSPNTNGTLIGSGCTYTEGGVSQTVLFKASTSNVDSTGFIE